MSTNLAIASRLLSQTRTYAILSLTFWLSLSSCERASVSASLESRSYNGVNFKQLKSAGALEILITQSKMKIEDYCTVDLANGEVSDKFLSDGPEGFQIGCLSEKLGKRRLSEINIFIERVTISAKLLKQIEYSIRWRISKVKSNAGHGGDMRVSGYEYETVDFGTPRKLDIRFSCK